MRYIMGDLHGCYLEYLMMLEKIQFKDEDELYILGDVIDRGISPIAILLDIIQRKNVHFIMGNHELMMYLVLSVFQVEITEESIHQMKHSKIKDVFMTYYSWLQNGGQCTIDQYRQLPREQQDAIMDYLEDSAIYEVLENNDEKYILVHAGLGHFSKDKKLEDYELLDLVEERADYSKRYFEDDKTYLVTGHTPTQLIWMKDQVFQENGHIALDCGLISGGQLATYCIETKDIFYIPKQNQEH